MKDREVVLGEHEVVEDMQIENLKIIQDARLYRFTSDSVLLSKFARVRDGDRVADFCAGSGIVAFHLYALQKNEGDKILPVPQFLSLIFNSLIILLICA